MLVDLEGGIMLRSFILGLAVVCCISIAFVGCSKDRNKQHQEVRPAKRSSLNTSDYEWLVDELAHERSITTEMLLGRLGKPKFTQDSAIGDDICWYYECITQTGGSKKLQIVISRKGSVRRVQLY